MWRELAIAVALVLVIEGIMPFLNPQALRRTLQTLSQLDDATLRFVGLTCMLLGVILLYVLN